MGRIDKALRRMAEAPLDQEPEAAAPGSEPAVEFPPEAPGDGVAAVQADQLAAEFSGDAYEAGPTIADSVTDALSEMPLADGPGDGKPREKLFETVDEDLAQKIVIDERTVPESREQYRKLAGVLHHAQGASGLSVVMIASAVAGEGKTLTACNLALTLSESYKKSVLLIDADLRKPMLHQLFRLDVTEGLSDGLTSPDDRRLPLREVSEHLTVLPAGESRSDPLAALSSNRMRRVLDEARHAFDWVIIDTPPAGLLTDASLLTSMVDGAVIVVRAGSTPYELVQRTTESIGKDRVLGVVLNSAAPSSQGYAYNYDPYGGYLRPQAEDADSMS